MDRGARICIVGGGPSGLAAALYLEDAGFERVTVMERGASVGGKCYSLVADGLAHEMGAVVITPAYEHTLALAERFGCALRRAPRTWMFDPRTGVTRESASLGAEGDAARRAYEEEAALTWVLELRKQRAHVGRAGYRQVPPELAQPFAAWCRERRAEPLMDAFVVPLTCFGYGSMEDLPTAYVMKNMAKKSFINVGNHVERWPAVFEEGYQGLMRKMGAALRDLRLGCEVVHVERGAPTRVTSRRGGQTVTEDFDAVVLAVPLDARGGLGFLDLHAEERRLFSQVRYLDYATTAARVEGLPAGRSYATILDGARITEPPPGSPCLFLRFHEASNVAIFYTWAQTPMDTPQIEAEIAAAMTRMGARVESFLETRMWEYFPHVSAEVMAGGFFDQVEGMQGQAHTYYTGGQLDFDIVEGAVSYSRHLVDRYFL